MTETTRGVVPVHGSQLTGNDSWWDAEADNVAGFDLIKSDALFSLVGVPFRVLGLTYRPGLQAPGVAWRNDYVSVELRVAPWPIIDQSWQRILSRRTGDLIASATAIAGGGEQLVVNDGSTGMYRQTVQYLEGKELIRVPTDLPAEGGKNQCRYDLPHTSWLSDKGAEGEDAEGAFVTFEVSLDCLRGLRYSDYENPTGAKDRAVTFYIA